MLWKRGSVTVAGGGPAVSDDVGLTRGRRRWLAAIILTGFALRAACLAYALRTPGYVWEDPDGYMARAMTLAAPGGWRWTFEAVTYEIRGQRHALPPGYSVFLSLFAAFPGFPVSAQVAQVVLAGVSIALVFSLGRLVHGVRAGLIAAAGYALWAPNILNVWSTSQETVYIPLVLAAFVILGRGVVGQMRVAPFAAAGVVFGLAALTRSMPLFFVVPAALLHVAVAADRRRAALQAGVLLLAFLATTGPYTAALSRHFGALTVIDTHGSIHVDAAAGRDRPAPGPLETLRGLWQEAAADPSAYVAATAERARSLLHVNGGRILQIYIVAGSRASAAAWKAALHLGGDGLLLVSATLAALGAALCGGPRLALLLVLWSGVNIAIASAGGFSGARLRAPFEPILLIFAAVVFAGAWRPPRLPVLAAAAATGVLAAAAVVPQLPRALQAWPDYGVRWPSIFRRDTGSFSTAAGINVLASGGAAALRLTPSEGWSPELHVRVGGIHVRTLQLTAGQPATVRVRWPEGGIAFVELAVPPGPGVSSTGAGRIDVSRPGS